MEPTTITAMVRVRRWRWWPFAHRYVPAPTMRASDLLKVVSREERA